MKKLLNPIAHFDEKKLLITGLLSVVLNIALGYFFGIKMISILKFAPSGAALKTLGLSALRAYAVAIVVLYLYGFLINRKTRLLDIVNTVLISMIPVILINPIQKIPVFEETLKNILRDPQAVLPSDLIIVMLLSLIMIPFIVYQIALLLNGFRTATNLKAWYYVVIFFVLLFSVATFTPYLFKL